MNEFFEDFEAIFKLIPVSDEISEEKKDGKQDKE